MLFLFGLGLLLPIYTITGYDASAHTSEETKNAAVNVPKSIISAVVWSSLIGWGVLIAITLAIPDMDQAAAQGFNVFFWTADQILPSGVKLVVHIIIAISQFLCGLATVTSVSRMMFAFSRDGGLPGSHVLKKISPKYRTPVAAIWVGSVLAIVFTAYTPLYTTIVSVTVIFLFLSFVIPIVAGAFAFGKTWTKMGPWNIGTAYIGVTVLSVLAMALIFYIGVQPPNDGALKITLGFLVLTALVWFALERRRFKGPPIGDEIAKRQADIRSAEATVGEA
jgi:amino acid transporter